LKFLRNRPDLQLNRDSESRPTWIVSGPEQYNERIRDTGHHDRRDGEKVTADIIAMLITSHAAAKRARAARLFLDQEESTVAEPSQRPRVGRENGAIDPVVKSWIDNVIVSALIERWNNRGSKVPA
jgi:hypothetical protein